MIEFIKSDLKIDFASKFTFTSVLSITIVLVALYFTITGMNYGVDFRGGAEIQIKFQKNVTTSDLRKSLHNHHFDGAAVQTIGDESEHEFLVKAQAKEGELNEIAQNISKMLKKDFEAFGAEVRKVDIVGPKAGAQLRISGFQAMAWALLAIMVYIDDN